MAILTNLNPVIAYTASVVTDGSGNLTNGLGTPITSINATSSYAQSASFSVTSSISVISQFDISSSFASQSISSSFTVSASNAYWANSSRVDDIDNGLVVYLPFSEGSGSQIRNLSPYGVDATKYENFNGLSQYATGSGWNTNSKRGGYSQLLTGGTNGSASWVEFNNSTIAAGLPSMSFAIWYQSSGSTAGTAGGGRLVTKFNGGTVGEFSYFISNGSQIAVILVNSLNQRLDQTVNTPKLNDNKWHHIVGTYNGYSSSVYVDGLLCGATPFTGSLQNSPYKLRVGTFENLGLAPAIGYVDEFKLWGRALTSNEILYLYNDGNLENGIYTDANGNNSISGTFSALGGVTGSLVGTASFATTASSLVQNGLVPNQLRISGDIDDVYLFNTQSALFVTNSGSGAVVGMGNGICFADAGFQTAGTIGFQDIAMATNTVAYWDSNFSLTSSIVTATELSKLNSISQSVNIQSQIDGKQASLLTASVSPSTPGSPAGWVNITVQGVLYWIPIYK